jgi:hypothetical protein
METITLEFPDPKSQPRIDVDVVKESDGTAIDSELVLVHHDITCPKSLYVPDSVSFHCQFQSKLICMFRHLSYNPS